MILGITIEMFALYVLAAYGIWNVITVVGPVLVGLLGGATWKNSGSLVEEINYMKDRISFLEMTNVDPSGLNGLGLSQGPCEKIKKRGRPRKSV
jgi:hypothetical protein